MATPSFAAAPNIVLILTDDQGWSQMSEALEPRQPDAKSDYLETPNMARLMKEGMRFTSGYSPAPLCTPTRRSILCGTSAPRSGTEFKSEWVPADHMTIPKALKQANSNYRCAHFGKWGELMISTPEDCGYDESDGMTGNNTGGMPRTLGSKGGHNDGPPHFVDNTDPKRTPSVTDSAIQFMKKQHDDGHPFYVQVSYYATHLSVVAKQQTIDKYNAKGIPDRGYTPAWAAMLQELDEGVGRIVNTIDELGLKGETYLFFTSDNGGRGTIPGGDEARTTTNFPLTGAKHDLLEGGIRVPFIAWGGKVSAGMVCREPVVGYDFLPTFYEIAGGEESLPNEVDGVSLLPLIKDANAKLDRPQWALFFHRPGRRLSVIRQGDFKLLVELQANGKIKSRSLFNLAESPTEEGHDISSEQPEKVEELERTLVDYLKSVNAKTPGDFPKKKRKKKN
ncbi:sulfatase [Calycomorphotria hydatis]|nr:sulfatase [Calycomorphotria hydatis]